MPNLTELLNSKKTVFIGSSPENDIVLSDAGASPIHCQISKLKNGVFMVVDLESESGTFVNDQKITKGIAGEYDTIKIGNHSFQLNSVAKEGVRPKQTTDQSFTASDPDVAPTENSTQPEGISFMHHGKKSTGAKDKIVVYFLAAPEDEVTCEAIHKHLSTIRFTSPLPIEMIGDFKLTGGEEIATHREKINQADIFLAFVSVDFLNNNNCYELLKTAIDNHNKQKAILLPILVRNCMWKTTPFANLPLLPKNHQPLNNKQFWNSEDDALTSVADEIYHSISELTKNSTPEEPITVTNTQTLKTNWRKDYLWKNFWKRTAAYLLDVLIIMLPLLIVQYMVFGDDFFDEAKEKAIVFSLINTGVLMLAYSYFDSSKWRGTPGKHLMQLRITDDVGNPISFGKALTRNAFKFFLLGFVGGLDESGVLSLLIIFGQVGCYAATRKFIHDYLTHTVIGERLQVGASATETNTEGTVRPIPVKTGSVSMVTSLVGVVVLICIVLFGAFKLIDNKNSANAQSLASNTTENTSNVPVALTESESEPSEEVKSNLIDAILNANKLVLEAYQKGDASYVSNVYTGAELETFKTDLAALNAAGRIMQASLQNPDFQEFVMTNDGQGAKVTVAQYLSGQVVTAEYEECVLTMPYQLITQTFYLELVDGYWMINKITTNPTQPIVSRCDGVTD